MSKEPDVLDTAWCADAAPKGDCIHVYPLEDMREHLFATPCWCEPDEDDEGEIPLVIHHAADGREDYETGQRKRH